MVAPFDGMCETLVGPLDGVVGGPGRGDRHRPVTGERAEVASNGDWRGRPRPARGAGRRGDNLVVLAQPDEAWVLPTATLYVGQTLQHHVSVTLAMRGPPMIAIRETGLVYRNPRPELRSRHTWHPTIVRFDDGELLVTFDIAEADVALDYRTYCHPFDRRRGDLDGPPSASSRIRPAARRRTRSGPTGCPTARSSRWAP